MGSRPTFKVVLGVTDCKQEPVEDWQEMVTLLPPAGDVLDCLQPVCRLRKGSTDVVPSDHLIVNERLKIAGLILEEMPYDNYLSYILTVLHPQYQTDGYVVLPSLSLDEDRSDQARFLRWYMRDHPGQIPPDDPNARQKWDQIEQGKNYAGYFWMEMPVWMIAVEWLLAQIGIMISQSDLKLMMVYQWE